MATTLPPGFRFHPTDVELIKYYLKRKVLGKKIASDVIAEVDVYKNEPWDLPDKSYLKGRDLKWYFFCPRQRKYSNGGRMNRATESGYWKTTGKDRVVLHNSKTVGMIKTLVFHKGRAPKGDRTDWVMHEYRLDDKDLADGGVVQDAFVLCIVFQKDGPGPRNGAQYGAPFKEDDEEVSCGGAHALSAVPAPLLPSNHENSSGGSEIMRTTYHDVLSLSDLKPTEDGLSLSDLVWDDHSQVQDHDDLLLEVSCGGHALSAVPAPLLPSNEKSSEGSEILCTSNGDGFSLADHEPTEDGLYLSDLVQEEDSDILSMMDSFWEDSPGVYLFHPTGV